MLCSLVFEEPQKSRMRLTMSGRSPPTGKSGPRPSTSRSQARAARSRSLAHQAVLNRGVVQHGDLGEAATVVGRRVLLGDEESPSPSMFGTMMK